MALHQTVCVTAVNVFSCIHIVFALFCSLSSSTSFASSTSGFPQFTGFQVDGDSQTLLQYNENTAIESTPTQSVLRSGLSTQPFPNHLAESHEEKEGLTITTLPRMSLMLCSDTGLRYVSGGYSTSSSSGMADSQTTSAPYSMGEWIGKQCPKRCRHIEMIEFARMRCYQAAQPTGRSALERFPCCAAGCPRWAHACPRCLSPYLLLT